MKQIQSFDNVEKLEYYKQQIEMFDKQYRLNETHFFDLKRSEFIFSNINHLITVIDGFEKSNNETLNKVSKAIFQTFQTEILEILEKQNAKSINYNDFFEQTLNATFNSLDIVFQVYELLSDHLESMRKNSQKNINSINDYSKLKQLKGNFINMKYDMESIENNHEVRKIDYILQIIDEQKDYLNYVTTKSKNKSDHNINKEIEHPFSSEDLFRLFCYIDTYFKKGGKKSKYTYIFRYFQEHKKEAFSQKQFFEFASKYSGVNLSNKKVESAITNYDELFIKLEKDLIKSNENNLD